MGFVVAKGCFSGKAVKCRLHVWRHGQRAKDTILNLEKGDVTPDWGRIVFNVEDVDRFWAHLKEKEFSPNRPRDAAWGERYFHLRDPDRHELSFAHPIG